MQLFNKKLQALVFLDFSSSNKTQVNALKMTYRQKLSIPKLELLIGYEEAN